MAEGARTGLGERIAFWSGIAAAVALIGAAELRPETEDGLPAPALAAAGVGLMMAIWWMTEAVPLPATALAPLALFPLLGVTPLADVGRAYADPLIFLFLGGFLLARAIERWGLHKRLAMAALAGAGGRPANAVAAVMAATAFLSLWISNTASAMVMAPIAASIAAARPKDESLAVSLMLGVAFAATIGGMGTVIGTPPNALFAAYMRESHGVEIGFAEWMMIGLPVALTLLPVAWWLLVRVYFPPESGALAVALQESPRLGAGARRAALIAGLAALGWVLRPALASAFPALGLSDAGIAMLAALSLFILPSGEKPGERLLDWETASGLRWDVLILFGGGLALAAAIDRTGLAAWIGAQAQALQGLPILALLTLFALIIVYLGELASNTAMAAIFLPVAGAAAVGMGADPLVVALPVALAASIGFMLPVATPPNAIVFIHPAVTRARMLRVGAPLDVIGLVVALAAGALLAPLVF